MRNWTVRTAGLAVAGLLLGTLVVAAPSPASATTGTYAGSVDDDSATTTPRTVVQNLVVVDTGTISATLDWADASAKLTLLLKDPSGTQVAAVSTLAKPKSLTYEATVTGTYKLSVFASAGSTAYMLSVDYPGPAPQPAGLATYDTAYGFPAPAGMYAYGLDWDPTDNSVLAGDYWNYRVRRYGADGTSGRIVSVTKPVGVAGGIAAPYDVETDLYDLGPDGLATYWVADQGSYRIVQFSHEGTWLQSIGLKGSGTDAAHPGHNYPRGCGNGAMSIPTHIHVDPANGQLYVADPQCRSVYMFSHTGTYLGQFNWGAFKTETGIFQPIPRGLAEGPDGLIYVVEHQSRSVVVFDKAGNYLRRFPRQADMNDPRGLDIDPVTGTVVVVAAYFNAIFRFAPDGTLLSKWTTVDGAAGRGAKFDAIRYPAVDGDGNIYVGETWGTRQADGSYTGYGVYKYSREGVRQPWSTPAAGPPDGGYNQQNGIALDNTGRLHVVDTFEQRVQRFDTTSSCLSNASCSAWQLQYGSRQPAGSQSKGFGYPRALTHETQRDYLWVGDNNNAVLAFTPDGAFVHRFGSQGKAIGQFSGGVQGLQVVGNKVYTTDVGNCRLSIWDEDALLQANDYLSPTGTPLTTMGTCGTGANQMGQPRGIAVGDAAGDPNTVYVAETATSRISKWDVAAKTSVQLKPVCDSVALKQPWGITWDPTRSWLYIGDVLNGRIVRIRPDGVTCQVVTKGLDVPEGKLRGSNFLEFDAQGRLYASDNNRRVYRFLLNG